jgi:hypothetical protein
VLISESFSICLKSRKKRCQIIPEHLVLRAKDGVKESDLAPFFGDLSQSEKLSEINPPLEYT